MKILSFIAKVVTTEFAIFDDDVQLFEDVVEHAPKEPNVLLMPRDQGEFRFRAMMNSLACHEVHMKTVDVIIT